MKKKKIKNGKEEKTNLRGGVKNGLAEKYVPLGLWNLNFNNKLCFDHTTICSAKALLLFCLLVLLPGRVGGEER